MIATSSVVSGAPDLRARIADALVLLVLLPAWLVCFALCARDAVRDTPYPSLRVKYSDSAVDSFPVVVSDVYDAPVGATRLEVGDRLLRWSGESLAHRGQVGYYHVVETRTPATHVARVTAARGGREFQTEVATLSYRVFFPRLFAGLVFLVACLFLHFRAAATPVIRSFEWAMWGGAFLLPCFFGREAWLIRTSWVVSCIGCSALAGFLCRALLLLAGGKPKYPRWQVALPWVFALLGPLDVEREFGEFLPQTFATVLFLCGSVGVSTFWCVAAARAYRRANPIERRKIKWLVWGIHVAVTLPSVFSMVFLIDPDFAVGYYLSIACTALFPLSLLIAVLWFNLFDVDRVISHTAFYSTAGAVLLIAVVGLLPQITASACMLLDLPVAVVQLGVAFSIVIACVLGQRHIVPAIEQRLHPERFAFEAHVSTIIDQVRAARTPHDALESLSVGLAQHLRPLSFGIYFRAHGVWGAAKPVGRDLGAMLSDASTLLATAARTGQIITVEGGRARRFDALDDHDRDLVTALDLALVIPLHRNAQFIGVILLGRKSSGDVYVASEYALLLALTQVLSQCLANSEWQAVIADIRRGREAFRRYVPAAIADEIAQGRQLEPEEREVALLFVDIRGYSGYSEGRSVSDVFSTVDKYTQLVSSVATRHGGNVVEFNGDGMMIVFGAPQPLVGKELRAVEAALEIHESMAVFRECARSAPLSVGIGIASGLACVGSLRAVDRWIWTALGETTNRAARLQALTRDLQAEIIIDETTWSRSGAHKTLFVLRRAHPLRGLHRRQNLYVKLLSQTLAQGA